MMTTGQSLRIRIRKALRFLRLLSVMVLTLLVVSSCAHRIRSRSGAALLKTSDYTLALGSSPANDLKVLYTGCGGMIIASGNEAVVIDPFYTGHGFLKTLFCKIKPDPANTDRVLNWVNTKMNGAQIKAVLLSHSHYDHMEDLPAMIHRDLLPQGTALIGSSTAECYIKQADNSMTVINADAVMHRPSSNPISNTGSWITVSSNIRVLPIESRHAPHFYGIHAMTCRGSCETNCCNIITGLETEGESTKARRWKEGSTYSFLVDITNGGKTIRLFIQTSASSPPFGMPPQNLLTAKQVDVAFYCMASFNYVNYYPDNLDGLVNAKQSVIIHWENFFKDLYRTKTRSVPFTNPAGFFRRLRYARGLKRTSDLAPNFSMPKPGVMATIRY